MAEHAQEMTGETVEIGFVDQGNAGEQAAEDAGAHEMWLDVVKLPIAKRGFILLPRLVAGHTDCDECADNAHDVAAAVLDHDIRQDGAP